MFKLLGVLFLGLIALLLAGVILFIRMLINTVKMTSQKSTTNNNPRETINAGKKASHTKRKKLFSENEGEYVDYEEIKR